jgi:hypothetical protein
MNEAQMQYLLKEHDNLRKEIEELEKHLYTTENFALLISGGFWAWILTNSQWGKNFSAILFVPAIISFLLFIRWISLGRSMSLVGRYLLQIEKEFNLPHDLGWENYLLKKRSYWVIIYHIIYFFTIFIGNLLMALKIK